MPEDTADDTIHVFIDTSIYLSFYSFTNDDLEQIRKLVALIEARRLKLYVPTHVRDEFYRNREAYLAKAIKHFDVKLPRTISRFMEAHPEAKAYLECLKEYDKATSELVDRTRKEAKDYSLTADVLVTDLIKAAGVIAHDQVVYEAAHLRMQLGNPPGKDHSLGDRLHWETLLANVPRRQTLTMISRDGDFQSDLFSDEPHPVLAREWFEKKSGQLTIHSELNSFLAAQFPDIKLASDIPKRAAIESLKSSRSFSSTHAAIAGLTPFKELLTREEVQELAHAALTNFQRMMTCRNFSVTFSNLFGVRLIPTSNRAWTHSLMLMITLHNAMGAREPIHSFRVLRLVL